MNLMKRQENDCYNAIVNINSHESNLVSSALFMGSKTQI